MTTRSEIACAIYWPMTRAKFQMFSPPSERSCPCILAALDCDPVKPLVWQRIGLLGRTLSPHSGTDIPDLLQECRTRQGCNDRGGPHLALRGRGGGAKLCEDGRGPPQLAWTQRRAHVLNSIWLRVRFCCLKLACFLNFGRRQRVFAGFAGQAVPVSRQIPSWTT